MLPWRNWLHCSGSTYGTWLRGDPRGWRARHHREHVEGDYRNPPPPGTYDALHEHSKRLMKGAEVLLDPQHRAIACREMSQTLLFHQIELVDLCVSAAHYHLLARFTPVEEERSPGITIPGSPLGIVPPGMVIPGLREEDVVHMDRYEVLMRIARHYVGIAKKRSAWAMKSAGVVAPKGVWTIRGSVKAIVDRQHQLRVVKYIRDHGLHGAAVWSVLARQQGKTP